MDQQRARHFSLRSGVAAPARDRTACPEQTRRFIENSGIASVVQSDDAGGAYPFDLTGAARLLVDEMDVDAARAVLSNPLDADRKEQP